jgi:AMP deaminase
MSGSAPSTGPAASSPLLFLGGIALGGLIATGTTLLYVRYVRDAPGALLSIRGAAAGQGSTRERNGASGLTPKQSHHGSHQRRRKSQQGHRKSFGGANGSQPLKGINEVNGLSGESGGARGSGTAAEVTPARALERQDTSLYYRGHREDGRVEVTPESERVYGGPSPLSLDPSPGRYALGHSDAVSESEGGGLGREMSNVYTAGPADRSNLGIVTRSAVAHGGIPTPNGGTVTGVPERGVHFYTGGNMQNAHHHAYQNGHQNAPYAHRTTQDVLKSEGSMIEDAALHEQYNRVLTPEMPHSEETQEVCHRLKLALAEREKWVFKPRVSPQDMRTPEAHSMKECLTGPHVGGSGPGQRLEQDPFHWDNMPALPLRFHMVDGVVHIFDDMGEEGGTDIGGEREPQTSRVFAPPGNADEFFATLHRLVKMSSMGHVRSFTHHRMQLLEQKFNLHVMLNADKEFLAQKSAPHRDFYNVRKVDTHVHHSACMHQKHLLRFIKSKLKKEPDELVIFRDGKFLTLKEVFESLNLTSYDLSVDSLDVHADKNIFHRFDKFNLKYNPFGQARLREIFIKQENIIRGRFLAELTKEVFNDLESSKYQLTEYRISIYGRKPVEWDALAAWVVQNRLYSDNNLWMIQIPRLYNVYKAQGILENFQQFLDNIFLPMFEATINPESHPMLHIFLKHVSGFDLVDDESKPERRPTKHMPTPAEWNIKHNPPYAYYTYYVYANLFSLNKLRESRGLNTFSLRPHCGEAGDLDHLAATFLLAENIAHGINLRKSPCLQYLYYVAQIGLMMSPLSNNSLFLDYHRNPFPQFFARGLSVSLSTDDPLQIHLTREPLVEEYSVAAQVWKMSATDLCEIARNSIIHSGFPHQLKMHWVHTEYWKDGPEGNNIQKTNVPSLRMIFRKDCLYEERSLIRSGWAAHQRKLSGAST